MIDCRSIKVPLAPHFKLSSQDGSKYEDERKFMDHIHYPIIVGSLMYDMICIRPNLAYPMSVLSRYMKNLGKAHWEALK